MMRDCRRFLALTIVALLGGCTSRPRLPENVSLLSATDLGPAVSPMAAAPVESANATTSAATPSLVKAAALRRAEPTPAKTSSPGSGRVRVLQPPPPMPPAAASQQPQRAFREPPPPMPTPRTAPALTSASVRLGDPTAPTEHPAARLSAPVAADALPLPVVVPAAEPLSPPRAVLLPPLR
jgi:hypothetical protein